MTVQPLAGVQPSDAAIAQYLGLNLNDPKTHAVLAVCQRYQLDPVLKHVIVIPKGGAYITRDGLLHVAHRSNTLDGIVLEDQGLERGEAGQPGHYWAIVAVYRKDMGHPFRYRGRYPVNGSNKAFAPEMAVKCAEVMALRRAFDVTALPVLEEMHEQEAWPSRVDTGRLRTPPPAEPPVEDVSQDDAELWDDQTPPADE